MSQQDVPIQDCPVFDLEPLGGTVYEVSVDGKPAVLIGESAVIKGKVLLPNPYGIYHVHCRSRFARARIEIRMLHEEISRRFLYSGKPAETVSVLIHNVGRHLVLFREGTVAVAVADYLQITRQRSTVPHAVVCPEARSNGIHMFLSIGNQRLQIIEEKLPLFPLSPTRGVPYIDPLAEESSSYTKIVESEEFLVQHGDSFVVNSREYLRIPHGEVALLHSITDDFVHSSALLIYPGSEGYQAFEFVANRPTTVTAGTEVMMLSLYQCPAANGSGGRYARQDSLSI